MLSSVHRLRASCYAIARQLSTSTARTLHTRDVDHPPQRMLSEVLWLLATFYAIARLLRASIAKTPSYHILDRFGGQI